MIGIVLIAIAISGSDSMAARKLPRFLTPQEVQEMFKVSEINPRDNLLLKCMFYIGLRNSEARNLRIEDVDLINRTVKVVQGKGKKDRYVPIPGTEFLAQLQKWFGNRNEGLVFYISDRHIRRIVKDYANRARIRNPNEVHPHTLRHSYATYLQNSAVPLNVIQQILGHERIETTTVYVHLGLERMREHIETAFKGLR
jgi:integrase/recombinase XerD